jgi:hypothetical protein
LAHLPGSHHSPLGRPEAQGRRRGRRGSRHQAPPRRPQPSGSGLPGAHRGVDHCRGNSRG